MPPPQCDEVGENKFMGKDLRMKSDRLEAATWYTQTVPGETLVIMKTKASIVREKYRVKHLLQDEC